MFCAPALCYSSVVLAQNRSVATGAHFKGTMFAYNIIFIAVIERNSLTDLRESALSTLSAF